MKKIYLFLIALLCVTSIAVSLFVYPSLPEMVVIHWGIDGSPDGFASPLVGAFLMPIIMMVISLVLIYIPNIDPLKKNWESFEKVYHFFVIGIVGFLLYVHLLTLYINLGHNLNIGRFLSPAIGFLFIGLGFILPQIRQNWFMGIRTPWTLSSQSVWEKTHSLGGKVFFICGLSMFIGIINQELFFGMIMLSVFSAVAILFIYSYLVYKKEFKK